MINPYHNRNDYSFWSRSITLPQPGQIDPVVRSANILPTDKVATMGSCFAQHIARRIAQSGFYYFVPETAPEEISSPEAKSRNYGMFSCRYANIYTVRQALQLFERAFSGTFAEDHIWSQNERFIDGFRPQIEPGGFDSRESCLADRKSHLSAVRKMYLESNWLVFTLGLTEAWKSSKDGAIFPTAPGVLGVTDSIHTEFINFSMNEVNKDLNEFLSRVKEVNPEIRFILTVSPVPLIATFEDKHVLTATTYSKSVLRVAAEEAELKNKNVYYFPSFEIITSPAAAGRYYENDLRQVNEAGVNHVMRVFKKHYMNALDCIQKPTQETVLSLNENVVCDEELIEQAIRSSGF